MYNVPYDYRATYYDTPNAWYRYNNGYIYQVDPVHAPGDVDRRFDPDVRVPERPGGNSIPAGPFRLRMNIGDIR